MSPYLRRTHGLYLDRRWEEYMEIKDIYLFIHSFIHTYILILPTIQQSLCSLFLYSSQFLYNAYNNCEADVIIPVSKMNKLRILNHKFSLKLSLELIIFPMKQFLYGSTHKVL